MPGLPLLTSEALDPLFHLISTGAMIQKLSGFMRSTGNDSFMLLFLTLEEACFLILVVIN